MLKTGDMLFTLPFIITPYIRLEMIYENNSNRSAGTTL